MTPEIVVGLFADYDDAQASVNDMLADGFDREAINILANNETERFAAGCPVGAGASSDVSAPAMAGCGMLDGIGPIFAIGPMATAVAGTAWGFSDSDSAPSQGGLSGMGIATGEVDYYTDGLRDGGTLMAVRADTDECARQAHDAMARHSAAFAPGSSGSARNSRPGMRDSSSMIPDPDLYADEDSLFDEHTSGAETGVLVYAARR